MRILLFSLLLGTLALSTPLAHALQSASPTRVTNDAGRNDASHAPVLDGRRLRQAMSRLASQHPDLVSVLNVGESRTGTKIEALRIASGEMRTGRPAMLIVGNIDGPLVYTSGIVMGHAQSLVSGYGEDETVTELLDGTTLYIIPCANPEAAEGYFEEPRIERHATGHGVDNDRDGRTGEDDRQDVNGDGFISMMRVPDPAGNWLEDPTDERATIEAAADKGQRGTWKLVPEGRDSDGDGEASEDPRSDAQINHNFAHEWQEHDQTAGLFPTDEPEARGLCEFVLGHKDIQLVMVYGSSHNLGGKLDSVKDGTPARKRVPVSGLRASDAKLLEALGKSYRSITGNDVENQGAAQGSFQMWCYGHRGLFCLEIKPWTLPLDSPVAGAGDSDSTDGDAMGQDSQKSMKKDDPKPSDDAKRLRWIDAQGEDGEWRHLGWTLYEHPELGPVEIGGFAPFGLTEPPDDLRAEVAKRELEFLLEASKRLASVEIAAATARPLGGGLLQVEARIENQGFLPLLSTWGRTTRSTRPASVVVHIPKGAQLLAGERRQLISDLDGAGGHRELKWLIRGANAAAIGIHVETDHAGEARAVPEVQQ